VEIPVSPLHADSGARDFATCRLALMFVDKSRHPDMEGSNLASNNAVNIESVARALKDLTNLSDGPSPARSKPWKRQARQVY
jgi:hypothetical protein